MSNTSLHQATSDSQTPILHLSLTRDVFDDAADDALFAEWQEANARTPNKIIPCPAACSESGSDPSTWSIYPDAARLALCNNTLLFSINVFTEIKDDHTKAGIRACKADFSTPATSKRDEKTCKHGPQVEGKSKAYVLTQGGANGGNGARDVEAAGIQVSNYVTSFETDCNTPTIAFGYSGSAAIGFYAGSQVRQQGVSSKLLQNFLARIEKEPVAASTVIELCEKNATTGADYVVGIAASTNGDLSFIQKSVKTWVNGTCVSDSGNSKVWDEVDLLVPTPISTFASDETRSRIQARADCTTTTIISGDWCARVAQRCDITESQLISYNTAHTQPFCNTLAVGERVCCSPGTLPDISPKPNPDGSCFVYNVQPGDYCAAIAAAHGLTVSRIEELNTNTWGWNGCSRLWAGSSMCLSTGTPPFPAPVANAVCGPTVPGTVKPTDPSVDIATLNPCPINACCNIWGQCGITEEYCLATPADTGAPGSSAPGTNSCISNCGIDIIKTPVQPTPEQRVKVAYFAAWNNQRPCLTMYVDEIDTTKYTHIHFAFASLTETFDIDVSDVQDEFERFKNMTGIKKIISFGGWEASATPESRARLRDAFRPGANNRGVFRVNVINFVNNHGLDGVDFDWEYPGSHDFPGNDGTEGRDYGTVISQIRSTLRQNGKTVSFAAPASYYYLKNYPIEQMARNVDYVIYMTYDLHGQWDVGQAGATTSCPTGNCLRSHVDWAETQLALAMLTKAGVPSNKTVVGLPSYGRTFKMAQVGCTGPTCLFTGTSTHSEAAPGRCTGTRGYLADAEIREIIATNPTVQGWNVGLYDSYLVYNSTEWVGFMRPPVKLRREAWYYDNNFLGTGDWSVDLQSF
ncbi:glycoside hydrolase, subgroup, catalytic core [Podospora fimiseda]|uniref:chitinase n=1 Tax=Podospora fimiseda TaxID=252190 RepID=A0AAN7BY46_9PEZI|nr:glycoside hydrolase, subgroup, catalytic core [Podospora fimiseda]